MRLVCLSDTHGLHEALTFPGQSKIPDGDVLVFAGDADLYTIPQVEAFDAWLSRLPHKTKVFVAGNHDPVFQKFPESAKKALCHACYLQDANLLIEGVNFWGSPWGRPPKKRNEYGNAFLIEDGIVIPPMPPLTQVLVTHVPDPVCFPRCDVDGRRLHTGAQLVVHIHGHHGRAEHRRAAADRHGALPHSIYVGIFPGNFRRVWQIPENPVVVDLYSNHIQGVFTGTNSIETTRYVRRHTTVRFPVKVDSPTRTC